MESRRKRNLNLTEMITRLSESSKISCKRKQEAASQMNRYVVSRYVLNHVPNHKIMSLLLHNCSFGVVRNSNANICVLGQFYLAPVTEPLNLHRCRDPQIENHQSIFFYKKDFSLKSRAGTRCEKLGSP